MVNFIICEFNPFHNGHAYLLENLPDAPNICIMSSHVTQRGEFAYTDKWTRAEMALNCGADLVLELPAPFAMGQAEQFAHGAVSIIKATGLEGRLCFGTEGEVKDKLKALAAVKENNLSPLIKKYRKEGYPYAGALTRAYTELLPDAADALNTPNNMLGLEYIKAAPEYDIFTLPRIGVGHDQTRAQGKYCSASALRQNPKAYRKYAPKNIHYLYKKAISPDKGKTDLLWLLALRRLRTEDWDRLAPDGVGRRFEKAVQSAQSVDEVLTAVKTKCCTLSSLRRTALKAFIGECDADAPAYIRILGANDKGKALLKDMSPTLPILTKSAAVKELSPEAQALMEYESRLTDLYMYLLPTPKQKGLEYLTTPTLL